MTTPRTSPRTFIDFFVPGVPVQEGNIAFGNGHSYHREGDRLKTWRESIAVLALEATRRPMLPHVMDWAIWTGPVELHLSFTYKVRTKRDYDQPKVTRPDLSKLVRAVEDALTGVLWVDDDQITVLEASKNYVEEDWKPGLNVNAMLVKT